MSRKRVSMRKIYEVFRLKWSAERSRRQIATICSIARPTVADYLQRAKAAGFSWPLPEGVSDAEFERLLFPPVPLVAHDHRPLPNWPAIYKELKRKGVTLSLLWQEYKEENPGGGYQYSHFCQMYKDWLGTQNVVMRQNHKAGEKLFVDYAGHRPGSLTVEPEKFERPKSSLPCLAPALIPMLKPPGHRVCRIGSVLMSGPSNTLKDVRGWLFSREE